MKTKITIMAAGLMFLGSMASCNDFLDKEPLSNVTPESYFASEADLAAYSINNYNFQTISGSYGIDLFGIDNNTDNQATADAPSYFLKGEKKVSSNDGEWSQYNWGRIRSCNYFFDNVLPKYEAGAIIGVADNVKHYIGEMYVIRAYNYFNMLKKFGDLPIVKTALKDQRGELIAASARQPRNKVARFIIEDLKTAEGLLLETSPAGKNRISKNVAYLLHSRVALYEGTWEKHHRGTAFVPGGNGWPGSDAQGYDADTEINYFLGEAMSAGKVLGDQMVNNLAENTDAAEGMDASMKSLNPYYTMFCDEDMNSYKEVLMWKDFDESLGVTSNCQMELERNAGGSGWTRGMVNSFLMRNGLPIYADNSGYNKDWEKEGVNKTLSDRDSRIVIFTKKPGDVNYYANDGTPNICSISFICGDAGSKSTTGFIIKKGKHYSSHMANDHGAGTSGGIVFRGVEAMLNYMEACYENTGAIDATADSYWRAIRKRAKVDPDYTKTIAATDMNQEAKGDWGAYSHGVLVDPTLYNIRRERRCELCAEAYRWDDLKRWRAMDQMKTTPYVTEGMLFWGSVYETELADKIVVDPATGNISSKELSDYMRPYEAVTVNNTLYTQGGFVFTPALYLEPIGMTAFSSTASDPSDFSSSSIYQNPGWGIQGSTPPTDVE